MKQGAKAEWGPPYIKEKLQRGADGIEIQRLFKDSFGKAPIDTTNIKAIHLPLGNGRDCPIETEEGKAYLKSTLEVADQISKEHDRQITVICHLIASKEYLEKHNKYKELVNEIRIHSSQYPNLTICIENMGSERGYMNILGTENIELVKDIDRPNIRTCLDTCHALMQEHKKIITLKEIFELNKGLCTHIHLCNAIDTGKGYGVGTGHGVPFEGKDIVRLSEIMQLYKEYTSNADVVYEVREDDYLKCENYSAIFSQVNMIKTMKEGTK